LGVRYDCLAALQIHEQLVKNCGWILPYRGYAIVCDRPIELHWTAERDIRRRRIHRDGGPAVRFVDGWAIWGLNGVRVPQWLAETPDSQLDAAKIKEVDNAEVRREFVRKIGIERICRALNARIVDRREHVPGGPYELLELTLGNEKLRYLKMFNPSLADTYHVERVPTGCTTVEQARNFRNGFREEQMAEDGEDWYQHGDVVIVPRGAKRLKPWPEWIV